MRPHSFALVALVIATLAGCSGASETPISAAVPSNSVPSITPTPTPTAEQALQLSGPYPADELLFVITATAHNKAGAVAELRQEVYAPVDKADVDPELTKEVKKQWCLEGYDELYPLTYLRTYVSSTDVSPAGTSWPKEAQAHPTVNLTNWGVYDGTTQGFVAACYGGVILLTGSATGVGILLADSGPSEVGGWASQKYGFSSINDGQGDDDWYPQYEECTITLGPAAAGLSTEEAERFTTELTWATESEKTHLSRCEFGEDLNDDYYFELGTRAH